MHRIMAHLLQESDFFTESLVLQMEEVLPPEPEKFRFAFYNTDHEPEARGSVLFGTCTTAGVQNHCLVCFLDEIPDDFVSYHVPRYFTTLRHYLGERFDASITKNISLLVCYRQATTTNVGASVFHIEEDPYDFKKYVLLYTQSQVDSLVEKWSASEEPIVSFLNRLLYENGGFTEFKNQPMEETAYNLTMKFFIKLPFLKIEVKERPLENLPAVINEQLVDDLQILRDRILRIPVDKVTVNELMGKEEPTNDQL